MWHDLIVALCLVMVIEGVMPFLSPDTARKTAWNITQLDNRTLRIIGLLSMLAGIGILQLVNG